MNRCRSRRAQCGDEDEQVARARFWSPSREAIGERSQASEAVATTAAAIVRLQSPQTRTQP
jgi:hypothetical protein